MRLILDTCSLTAASSRQLELLAARGALVVSPTVMYELLHQLLQSSSEARARRTIRQLQEVAFTLDSETPDLWRQAFGLRQLTGAANSAYFGRLLLTQAAHRQPSDLRAIWHDFWRRGHIAAGPEAMPTWKADTATMLREQLDSIARVERQLAETTVAEMISEATAQGRTPPGSDVRQAMKGFVHDSLLESCWPMVRMLQQVAGAVGIETVSPQELGVQDDFDGTTSMAALTTHYGYRGGLEFGFRAFTFLVDRYVWGHSGHRNDFVDLSITTSVRHSADVFVTEEKWMRRYFHPAELQPIAAACRA